MQTIDHPGWRGTAAFAAVAQGLAAVLTLRLAALLPAQAVPLRLHWTLAFNSPPKRCIDGTSLVSHSLGLFVAAEKNDGYALLPTGSFYNEPANVPHFVLSKGEPVVVQISGIGPTASRPVDPPPAPE